MNVTSPSWRQLTREELRLLSTIANQVGIAIERARLAEESTRLARAEERARIAREIHDTLAQDLTAIALHIEGGLNQLERDPPRARERLEQALDALPDEPRGGAALGPRSAHAAPGREVARRGARCDRARLHLGNRYPCPCPCGRVTCVCPCGSRLSSSASCRRRWRMCVAMPTPRKWRSPCGRAISALRWSCGMTGKGSMRLRGMKGDTGCSACASGHAFWAVRCASRGGPGRGTVVRVSVPLVEERPAMIRIFVVDDHPIVRQGLVTVLEDQADFAVVGAAGSIEGGGRADRACHIPMWCCSIWNWPGRTVSR